jgi:hypothetical protein
LLFLIALTFIGSEGDLVNLFYLQVLTVIREKLTSADHVQFCSLDFERAILRSLAVTFPTARLSGCLFHLKMALRRQLGFKGLLSYFNQDAEFQLWINMILSLAFVPVAEVATVYDKVIIEYLDQHIQEWERAAERIDKFRKYVEETYIGKAVKTEAGQAVERSSPLFSHECWNKYEDVIHGRALTNNISEGFNSSWNRSLEKNASIWAVISAFKREESLAANKMCEAGRGLDPNARPAKKSRKCFRETELLTLCMNYNSLPRGHYLRQVSRFFS